MKLPDNLDQVTLYEDLDADYVYPPTTFLPFWEHELGNGDMFGLYWPIGRESQLPLVLETWHDSGVMAPQFSSFARFLQCAEDVSSSDVVPTPNLSQDPDSPLALLTAARESLKQGDVDACVSQLERAIAVLPEYTEALGLLAAQYRRLGNHDAAVACALRAIRCPPSFGPVNPQLFHWFARQTKADETTAANPLWQNRSKLTFQFGGEKQNDDYVVLRAVIDAYIAEKRPVEAFILSQAYGEYMGRETVSFRERYDFDQTSWIKRQLDVWHQMTGTSRDVRELIQ